MASSNRMVDKIHQVVAKADKTGILSGDAFISHVHLMKNGFHKGMVGKTVIKGREMKVKQFGHGVWVPIIA